MKYIIKRKNQIIAEIRPEGQLQTSIMGEELVTMAFSLGRYIRFQTGDSVQVYGNLFYLASEPQVEKISTREFRYSLEFQGVKYELSKVQYLFPDAQNVLNLSEFHIMGTARQMLDLLVQNANRIGAGWSLGNIDTTETKQLHFSAENCLSVLSKIAQEFHLEYWVDANKSIHLTERKAVSGYSFEYGKSKDLVSLTREAQQGSNIVTRLYAFGSEKNIAGNYRNGQKQLRMAVPYLEKNTDIYGIIEASQTFDVYPHRIGKVTAVNPHNPLQFTDNQLDFDLNEKDFNGTKYLINGVPLKVTFNTGQLAGYTFEVKEFGYHSATKTFTLLKNTDEKNIEVPSENLRPAVGDSYVLTDLIMPQKYIANAEAELQRKAQAYLNENSRERVVYRLATDPLYFKEQNVNLQLGSTILVKDADFNLEENLRIIRLVKDLQNPFKVECEVAERAEIAHIVREYLEEEKAQTALLQADKFNAEMARKAYRFGREISDNIFDGEGYFNTEKIKPLSIDTKLISVGSRMQQFALPDVLISIVNEYTTKNTQGRLVHLSLEENPREWHIPANTQTGISAGFHYIYIKAQKYGTNASVWVSSEKIAVESDPNFYHFEAGYLGSVENGNRRIRLSHGFTQISPHEITTGKIAPPSGNHYIELLPDRINFVGNMQFSAENRQEITQLAQNQVNTSVQNLQIGGRNLLRNSKYINGNGEVGGIKYVGEITEMEQGETYIISSEILQGREIGSYYLNQRTDWWNGTPQNVSKDVPFVASKNHKHLWVWINSSTGKAEHKNIKLEKGNKATDWSPAPEDLLAEAQSKINQATQESKVAWETFATLQANNAGNQALESAKAFAQAKDQEKETLVKAYADGKITQAERNAIAVAEAKSRLAEVNAKAHVDGKITQEERRAIADAQAKLQEAKNHANNAVNNLQIGNRNHVLKSRLTMNTVSVLDGGTKKTVTDPVFGAVIQYDRPNGGGNFQFQFDVVNRPYLNGKDLIFNVIAKPIGTGTNAFCFGLWSKSYYLLTQNSNKKELGNGWFSYWTKVNLADVGQSGAIGLNSVRGSWQFYAVGIFESTHYVDWSPAPEDTDQKIADTKAEMQEALNRAKAILEAEQNNIKVTTNLLSQKMDFVGSTKINGNTMATGVLALGNSVGANAFISGVGLSPTEERIAIGASSFEQRSQAPFRVLANGTLHAQNAHIQGVINATSGTIGGFEINEKGLIKTRTYLGAFDSKTSSSITPEKIVIASDTEDIEIFGNERYGKSIEISDNSVILKSFYKNSETDEKLELMNLSEMGVFFRNCSFGINGIVTRGKSGFTGTVGLGTGWFMEVTNGIITNLYKG